MKLPLLLASATLFSASAMATSWGEIGPVEIETVAVIGVPIGLHLAGNVEVKIKNGFIPPPGVSCDGNYITTLRSRDTDRALLKALIDIPYRHVGTSFRFAQVYLTVTDQENMRAYPGVPTPGITPRCSIIAARYVWN